MASLKKRKKSKFWVGCFTLPDGTRCQRSTKTRDKGQAIQIVLAWEKATRQKATIDQSRKVLNQIVNIVHGDIVSHESVKEYFERWLKRRSSELGKSTSESYESKLNAFSAFIGEAAKAPITDLGITLISKWRDSLADKYASNTVNLFLKALKLALKDAANEGVITESPAAKIKMMKRSKASESASDATRRALTSNEIASILKVIPRDSEWRGMVLAGLYTGQRLSDIAGMTKDSLKNGWWIFNTRKTNGQMKIPLAKPLADWIAANPSKDNTHVFPVSFGYMARAKGKTGTLSNQFREFLVKANLVEKRTHDSKGKGRAGARETGGLSFHYLRHTANSLLKASGVSESVTMAFIGHESKEVSRLYTHISDNSLSDAISRLQKAIATD